jgi:hypothetical protein
VHWQSNPDLYHPYLRARIARGRGVGDGLDYDPWLHVRGVPSEGTSSIVKGIHTGRSHHLLSSLEVTYFFLTERRRRPAMVGFREQWPILDIDRTLEICADLGVRHSYRCGYPEPFTIDAIVTERVDGKDTERAASIKPTSKAADPRVRSRLSVEHVWCLEKGLPWTLVDTSGFSKQLLATLRFMRAWFQNRFEPDVEQANRFSEAFSRLYRQNVLLCELTLQVQKLLRISPHEANNLLRYCLWSDRIKADVSARMSFDAPLVLQREHRPT